MTLTFLITREFAISFEFWLYLVIHEFIESFYEVSDFCLEVGLSLSR